MLRIEKIPINCIFSLSISVKNFHGWWKIVGIVFSLNLVMTKYVEGKIIGKNYPASTYNKHTFY